MFENIFAPSSRIPNPNPEQQRSLVDRWKAALTPDVRAGMMQFGASLLQPMNLGDDIFNAIGKGVGAAGETIDARRTERNKQVMAAAEAEEARRVNDMRATEQREDRQLRELLGLGQLEQGKRNLDIQEAELPIRARSAEASYISATRPNGTQSSSLDPDTLARIAADAAKQYQDIVGDDPEAMPGISKDQFVEAAVTQARRAAQSAVSPSIMADPAAVVRGDPDVAGPAPAATPSPPKVPTWGELQISARDQLLPIRAAIQSGNLDEAINALRVIQSRVADPGNVQAQIDELIRRKAAQVAPPAAPVPPPGTTQAGPQPPWVRFLGR